MDQPLTDEQRVYLEQQKLVRKFKEHIYKEYFNVPPNQTCLQRIKQNVKITCWVFYNQLYNKRFNPQEYRKFMLFMNLNKIVQETYNELDKFYNTDEPCRYRGDQHTKRNTEGS